MATAKATITPSVLKWARRTAALTEADAAKKLGVKPERLLSWEVGEDQPTIKQLRRVAQLYKRPVSVFYLAEEPAGFQVMRDLRRLPGTGLREYSPGLVYEMRLAQQRRALAVELLQDIDGVPPHFELEAHLGRDPEALGTAVRKALKVTYGEQIKWGDPRIAFNVWRERIERAGVLVFQMVRVESEEASGFALSEEMLPVIAVNRKDVFSRRGFSLLHEFAHLMLRVSGASDLDVDAARPPEDAQIEVFCNHVAAATLMPREHFLGEAIVQELGAATAEWSNAQIEELAKLYGVSREAVVRRLLTFGRTTEAFYRTKRAQYAAEHVARKEAERAKYADKDFRKNPARDAVLEQGRPFVRLVLDNYYQDRITLSDVTGYLGVRVRHIPRIEATVGRV
jgi:Zn-dependent peptidase ImmA (M78 family)